jgi:glycosyltransferase involved in cell wall biosynthesis
VAIGRLERVKGFDILIEACALLAARGQRVLLVIIGEGAEEEALSALATRLGIAESVNFAGRLPPATIRAVLHSAAAFVLPSRSEGMPLALMEALATGTPAIAAEVGGVARTADGAAILIPPENPQALSDAIAGLVGDPSAQARLQQRGRTRALALSMEAGHAAYEALLTRLARTRRT